MLAKDLLPWGHVTYYCYEWRDSGLFARIDAILAQKVREHEGETEPPSVIAIDSQTVKATAVGSKKGFGPNKKIKGRKRTIMIDKFGCILFANGMCSIDCRYGN
jgi:hypothetical protein